MSKVKIQGHASGSGTLTLGAPNTDSDRTITLPDTTGTLLDENSSVPAANLTGTIADARFPATLPAASATNLTSIPAANITGTLPAISGASLTGVNAVNSGRKNMIINGDMRVQQRGTASVTSGYFVDRFTLSACSASAVLTSSTPTEFPTAISLTATSGNPIVAQKIESKNCQHLSGQTVIVSFYAKNISNATTLYTSLQTANAADNFGATTTISEQNLGSLTGSWVKYTASWTVPAAGLNGLSLNILCAGTSTFTMGVTGVQLELGSTATDFEHRSYGEELALCKRYYEILGSKAVADYGFMYIGTNWTTVNSRWGLQWTVTKRASPTITESGTWYCRNSTGSSLSVTGKAFDQPSPYGTAPYVTVASGLSVGHASQIWGDDGQIYVDAEL